MPQLSSIRSLFRLSSETNLSWLLHSSGAEEANKQKEKSGEGEGEGEEEERETLGPPLICLWGQLCW